MGDALNTPELGAEAAYWRRLVEDLQEVMPIAKIAETLQEEDRQVWRWKAGVRPIGWSAIGLFLLHVKHCPERQCHGGPSARGVIG